MSNDNLIERYRPEERVNHWLVAISFILLALSGLALFHPVFFWLSNLFGSATWARILHPFIGLVMAGSFWILAQGLWERNRITDADREWLRHARDVLANRDDRLPEVGHYNAGQKVLFWIMLGSIVVLLISGILMWQPWFASLFPVGLVRLATVLHALAAFVLMAGFIVHVYAVIWVKGSLRAMTRGTVTRTWAKHHHPGWYREVSKGGK